VGWVIAGVLAVALGLLTLNMLGSLVRVVLGPTDRDRLTGVVLAGTSGIAFLLLAAVLFDQPALRDAALAICALTVVVTVVRIRAEQSADRAGRNADAG
jgi:multicomponent Na+:H+ antiporter subunit F